MKANELRDMSAAELTKKLAELKEELFNLRFQHAINQLENPGRIETVKKDMERNLRKTRVGVVVSDKMDKTIVVAVKDSVQHPLYKKIMKRTVKFKAHDEKNECGVGDRVEIMETRPISADKRWRLVQIIEKAK